MSNRSPLVEYIISNQYVLIQTDFMREIFMIPSRSEASHKSGNEFTITTSSPMYKGRLFVYENMFYGVHSFERIGMRDSEEMTYKVEGIETHIPYMKDETKPLGTPQDSFDLYPNEIMNFTADRVIDTTIGIFIANYLFLVYPFKDTLSYINGEFSTTKIEKLLAPRLMNKTINPLDIKDKYVNNLILFGQSTDIFCPGISEKTITIPLEITELRIRLVEENKEALERGDASVMSMIEGALITKYKEYLKGDPSMHFLLQKKYFNVALKKLFLTQGIVETFGSPGKYTFIDNPISNGWKQKDLPVIFNEVRGGSYARAIETADGGVIAKLILRVLQDTRITIPDCETKTGEPVYGTKDSIGDFIWNYTIDSDGTNTLISPDNASEYYGKDIVIRTPGYCQATQGYCAKCFGKTFEVVGQTALSSVVLDFSKKALVASLKKMHGTSHSAIDVSDMNRYVV